nr:phage antirepressor N-terminal domain-containing protein [Streptomyces sp. SID4945]
MHTVLVDGQPHVVLRPAVEQIGLDFSTQLRKLRDRSWVNRRDIPTVAEDGKTRLMVAVDVRTFLMWLATVNETKVAPEVRPTLIAYQRETTVAVEAYWTQGGTINPRATEDQLDSLIGRAKQQAEVLHILSGIVSPEWLETKARMVAARALGEEPEIDPLDVPLYVPDFLKGKGLARRDVESVQSWFGRRAAALYEAEHGEKPGKRQSDLPNGSVRETYAWTQRHLPLFEETWDRYYAAQFPTQLGLGDAA